MKKIAVVLPTYNEAENIEDFTNKLLAEGKNLPNYDIEIVISDSNSSDKTGEIAKRLSQKNSHIHYINVERGLGVGLIKGHQYSLHHLKPDIMAQLDADGQVDVSVLSKLVTAIEEGYDLALGSRFTSGGVNKLSFSRRIFSAGASFVVRTIMGPYDIKEVTNSARAFTPALFKKINLDRLPWKETTFIIMPAFLNEAIIAGAKYKEVPLVFNDRAEGYSKNRALSYTYDVIMYSVDARFHKWGINIPLYKLSQKIKFGAFL